MDNKHDILQLLRKVADGSASPEEALLKLKEEPFEDTWFWPNELTIIRAMRQGVAEVILWRRKDTGTDFPDCRSNEGKGTESSPDHKNE